MSENSAGKKCLLIFSVVLFAACSSKPKATAYDDSWAECNRWARATNKKTFVDFPEHDELYPNEFEWVYHYA